MSDRSVGSAEERRDALVTELAEVRALYERARGAGELRTRFFADVTHELRTPLGLVLGPVERLLAGAGLDPDQRRALEVAARNARTLLKHVSELLDVARLEAGAGSPVRTRLDLARLVRLTAANFEGVARERDVELAVEAAPLEAEVDPGQIERVLLNLLGNAFEFAPAGGTVRVTLAGGGGRARVEVADSGPGIPPERREQVFERFRQLDPGPARRHGGLGLGLAIAREFVEQHGGTLVADRAPEGGALLVADLDIRAGGSSAPLLDPLVDPELARAAADALRVHSAMGVDSAPPAAPDRPLVLVVEDNPEMNDFLRAALEGPYRTAAAHDGEEGLRLAAALRPELVLADVMMPAMGGEALLAALRARPELAGTPVVVLTARADDEHRARLLAAGAQDHVTKPVSVPELRARVGNLVAMKHARDVLRAELAEQAEDLGRLAEEAARRKRELQAALDAMRHAREDAERASAQKTTLMHLVSHELRTPLSSILLQIQRLRRDGDLTERQRGVVSRVHGATLRLVDLVESLLEFERIESGHFEAVPEPIDVGRLAGEVVEEARPAAAEKGLAVELHVAPGLPPLESDPRLVRVVLVNLVSNAVKFTGAGRVTVQVEAEAGRHRIAVRDTGRGIAAEDQARIFEPFEQLEALPRKHTPGIGLGLALVRELVGALGGQIAVRSEPGAGSAFTVAFPSRREGASRGEARGADPAT